jgi:hypothetical protein
LDKTLKVLVAAACITVIAGGAYMAVREWQRSEEQARMSAAQDANVARLYRLSDAQPGQDDKVRTFCGLADRRLGDSNIPDDTKKEIRQITDTCRLLNFL